MSSNQRGMFTAAQAKKLGVERYTLTRLEKEGIIERIVRGVYRMGGHLVYATKMFLQHGYHSSLLVSQELLVRMKRFL